MTLEVVNSEEEAAKILVAPTLTSLTWRVDVILSSSSVNRVMQPFIILRLGLSDGTFKTVELSVKSFHDLRFRVAEALHNLHKLESNYLFQLRV
ncbi:transcription, DNA-templated [Tritrichomonas musculus]|uniref:COMM domain-containing protein 5 n=1 Tax=Tritrichomonas musculus TaxID=1915356 RepID=A0ABR2KYR2_9EUKA